MSQTLPAKNKLQGAHPYELPRNYNTPANVLKMLSRHTNLGTTWLMILKIKPVRYFKYTSVWFFPFPCPSSPISTPLWDQHEDSGIQKKPRGYSWLPPSLPSQRSAVSSTSSLWGCLPRAPHTTLIPPPSLSRAPQLPLPQCQPALSQGPGAGGWSPVMVSP